MICTFSSNWMTKLAAFILTLSVSACGSSFDIDPKASALTGKLPDLSSQPTPTPNFGRIELGRESATQFSRRVCNIPIAATNGKIVCSLSVEASKANLVSNYPKSFTLNSGENSQITVQLGSLRAERTAALIQFDGTCAVSQQFKFAMLAVPTAATLSFGTHHACAINSNRSLFCWGRGWEGQVGDQTKANHKVPFEVPGGRDYLMVRNGTHTTCALKSSNKIHCWGINKNEVLGVPLATARLYEPGPEIEGLPEGVPVVDFGISNPFNLFTEHVKIGLTPNHACALLANGHVYCWGDNTLGQLGMRLESAANSSMRAIRVLGIEGAKSIAVGAAHTCAVSGAESSVACWGDNHAGQLGSTTNAAFSSDPVHIPATEQTHEISAGGAFTCLLGRNQQVKCWGRNSNLELGRGISTQKETTPAAVKSLGDIVMIYTGNMHACALTSAGKAYCWGDNYSGQLGTGEQGSGKGSSEAKLLVGITERIEALSLGTFSTCAHLENGKMKCWGHGYFGETGNGTEGANVLVPSEVKTFTFAAE